MSAEAVASTSVLVDAPREAGVGVHISLHPLPILSVSEHLTRAHMQARGTGASAATDKPINVNVYGVLLGTQKGRDVEVQNSFELKVDASETGDRVAIIDHAWLKARLALYKQTFPTFDFLGWYSTGSKPTPSDLAIHKQLLEYNESPLFLQLSPSREALNAAQGKAELPIAVYEGIVELTEASKAAPAGGAAGGDKSAEAEASRQRQAELVFVRSTYSLETGEAERIAVDHTSKPSDSGDGGGESSLVANLTAQQNAIQMLSERVSYVHNYIRAVQQGTAKRDEEALRQIAALLASVPNMKQVPEFRDEYLTEYNDVMLTSYLASMTKGLHSLNELVDKFDVTQSDDSPMGGGGGMGFSSGRHHGSRNRRGPM